MAEWLGWLWVLAAGLGLGSLFYGGLWWTVKRLPLVQHPALWILTSFFLRAGIALLGLYLLMAGDWRRLMLAVGGMLVVRFGAVKLAQRADHPASY